MFGKPTKSEEELDRELTEGGVIRHDSPGLAGIVTEEEAAAQAGTKSELTQIAHSGSRFNLIQDIMREKGVSEEEAESILDKELQK